MENHFDLLHQIFLNFVESDDFGDETFERIVTEFESHHWYQDTPYIMLTNFGSGADTPVRHRIVRLGQIPYTFTDDSFCFSVTDAITIRRAFDQKIAALQAHFPSHVLQPPA